MLVPGAGVRGRLRNLGDPRPLLRQSACQCNNLVERAHVYTGFTTTDGFHQCSCYCYGLHRTVSTQRSHEQAGTFLHDCYAECLTRSSLGSRADQEAGAKQLNASVAQRGHIRLSLTLDPEVKIARCGMSPDRRDQRQSTSAVVTSDPCDCYNVVVVYTAKCLLGASGLDGCTEAAKHIVSVYDRSMLGNLVEIDNMFIQTCIVATEGSPSKNCDSRVMPRRKKARKAVTPDQARCADQ